MDSVEEVIKVPDNKVQKLPETASISMAEEYITGVGMLGDRLITLLDADNVLTKTELIETGEMTQIMEETVEAAEENNGTEQEDSHDENVGKEKTERGK